MLSAHLLLLRLVQGIRHKADWFPAHQALPVVIDAPQYGEAQLAARDAHVECQTVRSHLARYQAFSRKSEKG